MKSDLTCPVEITKVTVSRETQETETTKESAQILCRIEFFNLSDKVIDSLQMNIICFDAEGSRLGGRLVRAAATGEPRTNFGGTFMPEHVDGAVRVDASVEKVWFKDGVIWRREDRNVREYTPNSLPQGRELDRLRAVAGPDAAGYAREDDIVWMCVCGRANRTSDDTCIRCERKREQVLRDYSFAAIDATEGQKERDLERKTQDTLRRSSEATVSEEKAKMQKSRRRRRTLTTVITLLTLAVLGLAAYRWGVPTAACYLAQQKMEQGLYADAKATYLWVESVWPNLFGAQQQADQAEEAIIGELIGVGSEVALQEAAARAKQLQTDNAAQLYDRAVIDHAKLALAGEDYEKGEALLASLPHSEEATELLMELIYTVAGLAREKEDYPTALERYASLGDYRDAKELVRACTYDYGRKLMLEEQYEAACEQLLKVSGREDAIELIRRCRYLWALEEQEKGELVRAAELFETLGIYEEAETRAKACRYQTGMRLLGNGDLEGAAAQLRLAEDHEDAKARFADAALTLGSTALSQGDYEGAIAWLEQLEREGEAGALLNQATYAYADKLEADGYSESAALQFSALGDYKDAAARANKLEYALAMAEMVTAPHSALLRFEALGKYEDAAKMASACRYALAMADFDAGKYDAALRQFEALGDYEDAKAQVRRSRYALAKMQEDAQKYEEAAALYEDCGAYLDAEERAMHARYLLGDQHEQAGDYEQAAKAFAQLGSYEDAKRRTQQNEDAWLLDRYNAARMDMELGDFASVIAALEDVWQAELPERYAKMHDMYVEACLNRAQVLTEQGKPLDALPVLERIPDSKAAQKRLDAYVYRIIGKWKDARGVAYVFRRDGSCQIDGQELYFGGVGYELRVGSEPYPTEAAYTIVNLKKNTLSLKNLKTRATIRLTFVAEAEDAQTAAESAQEPEKADGE